MPPRRFNAWIIGCGPSRRALPASARNSRQRENHATIMLASTPKTIWHHDHRDEIAGTGAALGTEHRAIDDGADDARQEDDERVDDALDQRERDHVAVGHVRYLVPEDRLHFLVVHRLQQSRRYRDERGILEGTGRERIGRALVDADFGHRDADLGCQLLHGSDQPRLGLVARRIDDLRAGRPFGDRFGHQERDDRAGKADDEREGQERADLQSLCDERTVEAEQPQDDRQDDDDRQVGGDEQDDAFHDVPVEARLRIWVPETAVASGNRRCPRRASIIGRAGTSRSRNRAASPSG